MKKTVFLCFLVGLATAFSATAQTNTINFDDGTLGEPIGVHYQTNGVTASNAVWATNVDARGLPFAGATGAYVFWSQNSGSSPSIGSPIVFTFAKPQRFVAISASDIGTAGARVDAYDAVSGGNLVGTAQAFGTGVGFDVYRELEVSGGPIRRIHLYQPSPNGSDGCVWDNLRFAEAPSGQTAIQMFAGVLVSGWPNTRYNVQYCTNLDQPNWQTFTNVIAGYTPVLVIDYGSGGKPQRFYRAVVE